MMSTPRCPSPPWSPPPASHRVPEARDFINPVAWEHGLRAPFSIYPLFEGAARARLGTSFEGAQARSGAIWADFSSIAANNAGAWRTATMSAADILAPGPRNRLVAQPYRKLMCADMAVDQAAAVVLTTVAEARHLGIPEERFVYPLGSAGARDTSDFLERSSYARSPAMEASLDDALTCARVSIDAVDLVELYSCFPCVPKMASDHLGLDRNRSLSVTGGPRAKIGVSSPERLSAAARV